MVLKRASEGEKEKDRKKKEEIKRGEHEAGRFVE